jgi:hypothetical protein
MKLRKYLVDNDNIEVAIFEESVLQFYGNALKIYDVLSRHWLDAEVIEIVNNGHNIEVERDRR